MFFFTLQPKKLYAQQTNKKPHSSDIWEILSSGDPVQHSPGEWLSCLEIWQSFHFSFFICQSYSFLPRSLTILSFLFCYLSILFCLGQKLGKHIHSSFAVWQSFPCSLAFANLFLSCQETWQSYPFSILAFWQFRLQLSSSIWQSLPLSYDIGNHNLSCNSNWQYCVFSLVCKLAISFNLSFCNLKLRQPWSFR